MELNLLGDKVVIKREEAEEKDCQRAYPYQARQGAASGVVEMAVGQELDECKMEVKVGDKVIFAKYGGMEVKYEGEVYTILSQRDIMAVIE